MWTLGTPLTGFPPRLPSENAKKTPLQTLCNGSFNYTVGAVTANNENIVITNEPGLVHEFTAQFNRLWQEFA